MVQAAFKRLALKHHPDRNSSPDAHARMQELNEAYAIISDPAQREAYDVLRREQAKVQRQAEEQTRQQAEAERRAEAVRQRNEQMAAQRRAANERQEQARATAAQRRIEYEEQIRAQQAAQRRAKRERQQREWEAQQAAAQSAPEPSAPAQAAAPIKTLVQQSEVIPEVMPETQVWIETEPSPIEVPVLNDCERRKLALQQSQRALQDQIFKLDYGITDATEQVNYWSNRRFPWQIEVKAGQSTTFMIGGAITVVALLLAGFMLTLGGAVGWAAAFGLVGGGVGWWTWRTSLSIVPVGHLVEAWTEIKRGRELQRQHLTEELTQLEAVMRVSAARPYTR